MLVSKKEGAMEFTNLFGLLEDFNEDLNENIYKTFEQNLSDRKILNETVLF
ncbi:hypothetical protein GCM10023231_17180 [Olivibacter ginsenosidimutans]|uniref:Uncharacterized protein n=1 Tax=Olivibacter ginsenosidimutans TaxID=1176537 RepID=A0ABP9B2R9_9SPHI